MGLSPRRCPRSQAPAQAPPFCGGRPGLPLLVPGAQRYSSHLLHPRRPPPGPGPRVAVGWSGGGAFNCLGQGSEVRWAFWHGRQLGGCSGGGQWSAGASSRSQVGCILGLSTVGLDLAFRQLLKCCGHVSCLLLSCSLEERRGWLSLELRLGLWEEKPRTMGEGPGTSRSRETANK